MPQNRAIPELQKDLDDISSAIDAQQAILHALFIKRSETRRRLNFLLDPMARLPLEIQSHIFLCVDSDRNPPNSNPKPNHQSPPMLFLAVCQLWRGIALSIPNLWASLWIDLVARRPNHFELCEMWLKSARSLPLSITLHGSLQLDQIVEDLLAQYSHQFQSLTLRVLRNNVMRPWFTWKISEGSLSSLKTLSIEPVHFHAFYGNIGEWLGILRTAPGLSYCKMVNTFNQEEQEANILPSQPLMLASLECMHLGERGALNLQGDMGSNSLAILQYLTLPALKILTLSEPDIADEAFLSFFSSSSPPLESLEMTLPHQAPWPDTIVSRFLRLVPMLTMLDLSAALRYHELGLFLPFVDILGSSSEVLPHLRAIVFHTDTAVTIHYSSVLSMLRFRFTLCPTRLELFELRFGEFVYPDYTHDLLNDLPNEEVRVGLQQLVRDGLKIHIGRTEN
ncbi:hypothetical protein R3P38DRAFT_2688348, partial [Favolaschia claudopus]